MNRNIFLLFNILLSLSLFSQGKVIGNDIHNKYNKTLRLVSLYNKKYYKNYEGDSASILNGQYVFKTPGYNNSIPIPFRFIFQTEKHKVFEVSEIFYISKKNNYINFDSETRKIILDENDDSYKEIEKYNKYLKNYSSKKKYTDSIQANIYKNKNFKVEKPTVDSLQTLYESLDQLEDSELLNFSNQSPKSYVLFWRLVKKFEAQGFKQKYLDIFNNLDATIKKSAAGLVFKEELKKAELIGIGRIFPDITLQNKKLLLSRGEKYTLVDFWFSYCGPCLEQMPKYKELYSKYKEKGFEIINISTDRTKDVGKWKKVIKEKGLNWVHYLDENGLKTKYYNINKFPSNFLLDSSGKIIKIDILPEELENYLNVNLK